MDYFLQAAIIFQVKKWNIENDYNMTASRELDETIILPATNLREQETYDERPATSSIFIWHFEGGGENT